MRAMKNALRENVWKRQDMRFLCGTKFVLQKCIVGIKAVYDRVGIVKTFSGGIDGLRNLDRKTLME